MLSLYGFPYQKWHHDKNWKTDLTVEIKHGITRIRILDVPRLLLDFLQQPAIAFSSCHERNNLFQNEIEDLFYLSDQYSINISFW